MKPSRTATVAAVVLLAFSAPAAWADSLNPFPVRATDPQQAALASEAPQPVSGTVAPAYLYASPVHMYWLAFHTLTDARAFTATRDLQPDASLFKVATQSDDQGKFTVWLVPGYSYVPIWEAPSKGGVEGYFYWSGTIVNVTPFTPVELAYLLAA